MWDDVGGGQGGNKNAEATIKTGFCGSIACGASLSAEADALIIGSGAGLSRKPQWRGFYSNNFRFMDVYGWSFGGKPKHAQFMVDSDSHWSTIYIHYLYPFMVYVWLMGGWFDPLLDDL